MQILQIQQILNQAQTPTVSEQIDMVKPASSFADELKAAEKRTEQEEVKPISSETNAPKSEEKLSKTDESQVEQSEKVPEKKSEDEKLVKKDEGAEEKLTKSVEKNQLKKESIPEKTGDIPSEIDNQIALVQTIKQSDSSVSVKVILPQDDSASALSRDSKSAKKFDWLFEKVEDSALPQENLTVSDEKLAELLENAEEFIPGNESDKEKLENAQNLVTADPQKFLQEVENSNQINPDLAENGVQIKDSKELASHKDKKSPLRFEIKDLRTEKVENPQTGDKIVSKITDKKDFNPSNTSDFTGKGEVTMELMNTANANITSSSAQAAGADGSTFQSQLAAAVQENAPEFVKAGNIVLKDNNKGSINLILHPESLGNVKVHLSLSDKLITGTINVQSREAYEAFKESINSIKEAFAQSGFETGGFDLNFTDSSAGQFAQGQNDGGQMAQFKGRNAYGDFVTPQQFFEEQEASYTETTSSGVNIVA